ncbi:RNA polymerase II-associated protein 1 [Cydia pomonella]|uniref:RNA polymerase II-associated protein 1 n=1 Tax=Cydia pomonella TaxID=82600 RepID=UPI002ADD9886|nr:RNA polymerase II-associated protein 1 [Cydia pomonella]
MLKRPNPEEDEEDILRMQEEYLREKNKDANFRPSASVTNLRPQVTETPKPSSSKSEKSVGRKPSKYAQSKGLKNEKQVRFESSTGSVMGDILEKNMEDVPKETEMNDDQVYYPKIIPSVMSHIIEKNTNCDLDLSFKPMPAQGFPVAMKCDFNVAPGSKSIHSLYIQKKQQEKVSKMDIDEPSNASKTNVSNQVNLPEKSYIVSSKDADVIHTENVNLLSKLSEKEILEEQQKLLAEMDPNLIKFIKAKRKNENPISVNDKHSPKSQKMSPQDVPMQSLVTDDGAWDNDILSHPNVNKWLHFDSLEKDKLEWVKGIKESNIITPDTPYEARFDFKGYLLPYTLPYTEETKTLFHHGEEPHRPGYTLTEIFELTRSMVTQQRVFALNTLAGVLEYYSAGTYKGIIDIPLSKILFVLRFSLDDKAEAIIEPSLKAIRNLIYNRIDEASLDALLGFEAGLQQPCLENDKSEIEELESKESELKDYHLAEVDIIAALLRTDILTRVQYILGNTKPDINSVQYCLQILTRLARDSPETAMTIVKMEHLMNSVKDIFKNYKNNHLSQLAMRLFRVLSLQSREIGESLLSKYFILEPVLQSISTVADRTSGLRVQIEAFCIMTNLLHHDLAVDESLSIFPILLSALYIHVQSTDVLVTSSVLNATHAGVILQFASKIWCTQKLPDSNKGQLCILLKEGARKWLAQISQNESYTCGHLRLLCSVLDCCKTIITFDQVDMGFLKESLNKLSNSAGFLYIVAHLESSSNLLSGIETKDLHFTKNLMCLGASVIDSELKTLPILNCLSPIPFLASLFNLLEAVNDERIAQTFVHNLEPYIEKLAHKSPSLSDNWFTRTETDLVISIIKNAVKIDVPESKKDLLYAVANKLCYILRVDKGGDLEFLFRNIVFNKQWFTAERLMNLVSLSDADGFSKALTSIEEIKLCYSTVINMSYKDTGANIVLRKWQEPILPRDWIYLPILHLYSKSQEQNPQKVLGLNVKASTAKEFVIRSSLEWILFNEYCFPDLLKDINVTDRFCRLMCVFLCDNSLFLDARIKILLQKCLEVLFKRSSEFNFDQQLTGLSNFQGFYIQFLEQFQSVSYGDCNFAACVLVPLAQRHDVKWRKLIWSEYAGCLRALDCPEYRLCYELKDYLYPEETEVSLIKSYHRALTSNLVRPSTTAYAIAQHHVEAWNRRKDQQI